MREGTVNAGNLTVSGGTFTGSSGTVSATAVALSSGSLTAPGSSGTFNVTGNWSLTGGTFTHNSGTVTFNGTGAQSIGGSANTTFNGLTINKTPGTVTLGINTTATSFILTAGTFDASTYYSSHNTDAHRWHPAGGRCDLGRQLFIYAIPACWLHDEITSSTQPSMATSLTRT